MNETTGAELILIEPDTGRGRSYRAPAGSGSWALHDMGDGRLVVGTFYDGRFMIFDLRKRRFVGVAAFPGESYIWNLARGKDGRLYGGTYPGGRLGAFDPDRLTVEDCGAPAPPNMYLRYVSALPDGRILCSFSSEKSTTLIYDPAAKRFMPPPKALENVSRGVSWNGYFCSGGACFHGTTLEPVPTPPFPVPDGADGGWSVDTNLTTERTLWLWQGAVLFRYEPGNESLERFAEIRVPGGRLLSASQDGWAVGVRGQDYFVVRTGATGVDLRPIPTEAGPRPTLFLRCDPRGRVWGGPHFGQTLFCYDPSSRRVLNTRTISDHGGEAYDVAFIGETAFAASYSGGEIIRYQPKKPWDQMNHTNPRTIAELGSKGYIRPTGGIVVGEDGRLYSGWMAAYGTYGGALAVTSPDTGTTELIENPLGSQAISGVAVAGDLVFLGTSLSANGLPDKKGESPRFGVYDMVRRAVVARHELAGVSSVRPLAAVAGGKRVVLAVGDRLCYADSPDWSVITDGYPQAPRMRCNCVALWKTAAGAHGEQREWLLYGSGTELVALDCTSGGRHVLANLPKPINNVAAVVAELSTRRGDCHIYVSCGAELYRVRLNPAWLQVLMAGGNRP